MPHPENIRRYCQKIIGKRGEILDAVSYEPAKGGGWCVICSTEHAALALYYHYRYSDVTYHTREVGLCTQYAIVVRPKHPV